MHRHGSPFDRGAADSYYRRPRRPHYYKGNTYLSERVGEENMTPEEIAEYHKGFSDNEMNKDFKDYGWDDHAYDTIEDYEDQEEREED